MNFENRAPVMGDEIGLMGLHNQTVSMKFEAVVIFASDALEALGEESGHIYQTKPS